MNLSPFARSLLFVSAYFGIWLGQVLMLVAERPDRPDRSFMAAMVLTMGILSLILATKK